MAEGVDRLVVGEPPPGRGGLQVPVDLRTVPSEIGDQVGPQQRVDAVVGEGRALDQRRRLAEVVELPVGVVPCRQLGGEPGRQRGAHADRAEEPLRVRAQRVEDLAGQVLGHRALVPGEVGEEAGRVIGPAQGESGQPQAGSPALRARVQHGQRRRCQLEAGGRQQRGRLVQREAQGIHPQFVQSALQPEPRDRDRRVGPAREDQAQSRRPAADQPGELSQDLPSGQLLHVVEDQPNRGLEGVHGVREFLHDVQPARQRRHSGQPLEPRVPACRGEGQQRGRHRTPQSPGVVVVGVQRHPRRLRVPVVADPVRQQQRLPEPGGGTDDDDLIGGGLVQPLPESGTRRELEGELRDDALADGHPRGGLRGESHDRAPSGDRDRRRRGRRRRPVLLQDMGAPPATDRWGDPAGLDPGVRTRLPAHASRPHSTAVRTAVRRVLTPSLP
jgi:hypothetical protein